MRPSAVLTDTGAGAWANSTESTMLPAALSTVASKTSASWKGRRMASSALSAAGAQKGNISRKG